MIYKKNILIILLLFPTFAFPQGFNKVWMLGTGGGFPTGKIEYTSNSYALFKQPYKMKYKGTQATICDANGNFLMSSNGVWIANSNNDTMVNGSGLNPGDNVNSFPNGLVDDYANIILPFPGDSNKYILFHHTDYYDGFSYSAREVFYTIIDITLDSGRGAVISKNDTAFSDTLNWGLAACKHANGRDWWIIASKHNSSIYYKILLTPNGIESVSSQQMNVPVAWYNSSQPTFSKDGEKFINTVYDSITHNSYLILFDFDRCSGLFLNSTNIQLTVNDFLFGASFSSNGQYIYACTSNIIYQVNSLTLNIDTVAIYDGFCFPNNPWCTTFWDMYLAANGKIYITSGSAVMFIHEMNYPDSADTACDVQQHSIFLDSIWNLRAVPNHPNYYLGRLQGSPCDTLQWAGINEREHDFRFRVYPNPVINNVLNIGYLLPQNKPGVFMIYDVTGKVVFRYGLPQWSNEQSFKLPSLSNGIYNCVITSGIQRVSKKLAMIKE